METVKKNIKNYISINNINHNIHEYNLNNY